MNLRLAEYFQFIYRNDGYPPIRVSYFWLERIQNKYEDYTGYMFDPDFGPGWEFQIEAIDFDYDSREGGPGTWNYELVTSGFSKSLSGAHMAVKGLLPKEAWPYLSHQVSGRRDRFYFAYEYELAHGPDALHQEAESGWLERFQFGEASLTGDPPRD